MKQIILTFGLVLTGLALFGQSPRIRLNQITKDSLTGSVVLSGSDSNMVYSRDFFLNLTDSVLILFGDTLSTTATAFTGVTTDLTLTGNGTVGNELKVDTSLISTIKALNDTLTARGYLTSNQTITLSGDVTGSGTTAITATVVDDSHNHIISNVDFLQDSLDAKANDSDLANYVTLSGADTITGAKTFTNTFTQSGGDVNFDSGTLYVDESENRVGIGTSSPSEKLFVEDGTIVAEQGTNGSTGRLVAMSNNGTPLSVHARDNNTSGNIGHNIYYNGSTFVVPDASIGKWLWGWETQPTASASNMDFYYADTSTLIANGFLFRLTGEGDVGIGVQSPSEKLDVNGKVKIQDLTGTGGNAVYENGGVLGVASDARFKTYVGDIQNGIALINQLKPKYFIDNRNSSFQQLGFYAQEVKSVINEASYPIGNTDYLGINDRAILATTVKAIQEQQTIIETQATEIEQLKSQIQLILSEIEQIKNN